MSLVRAAALSEIPADRPVLAVLGGLRVALARVGGEVCALADACAHRGGPLSEGKLQGSRLACPWHGWIYDVRTGQCAFPQRGQAVPAYPVRVEGAEVWVEVP